ncbi:MAG TPA: amidohydrolase family protein [Gaiellaceae bacterium]
MKLSADWVLPMDGEPIDGGYVEFDGATIVSVGKGRGDRHFPEAAIIPGFVNAHSHIEYSVYAGFGDGLAFGPWITLHTQRKARLEPADMLAVARRGAADSLRSGITTTADYSFSGDAALAAAEFGLRAIVYLEVFAHEPAAAAERYSRLRDQLPPSELVTIGISPHSPYLCSVDVFAWCLSLGVPVGTHLSESANENEWLEHGAGPFGGSPIVVPPTGKRAVPTLESVLGPDLLCAHCVDLEPHELRMLAERDVPVAHCPRSNALLGCGVAPLTALREAGVRVGLGTDSPASAPSFDMFEEMRAAIYAARARERRAEALSATDALRLATADAARALQIDGEVGTLTPGKRADLAVVSLAESPYHPVEDPAAAVVFGGSPERVLETVVNGQTRYRIEDNEWREVRNIASVARGRMLGPLPR